nr:hypothetical protein [uncultured Devosia sp.]
MSMSISESLRSFPRPLSGQVKALPEHFTLQTKSTTDEFLEIARKSPAERMRDKIMEDLGVDEKGLSQMEPEARQAMEDEIKRRMMQTLQASTDTGQVVDKSA